MAKSNSSLPVRMKPLFWEYNFRQLRWDRHRDLIMLKVLATGEWTDWKWLRQRVTAQELRAWIIARHGRGLSPRQLNFWQVVLQIRARDVRQWLNAPERQIWDKR